MTLLIKNALCFIADEFKKSDVFITDGIITEISSTISSNGADRVIDALDKYFLIPGFVDVHTHLRQPGFLIKKQLSQALWQGQGQGIRLFAQCLILTRLPIAPKILRLKQI